MLKPIIKNSIKSFERKTGYDAAYMKDMTDASTKLALLFSKFVKLNQFRKYTPNDEMAIAKIAALKTEDCGPCLQLNIHFALQSGTPRQWVETAVKDPENLPAGLKLVYDFAQKIALNAPDGEIYREKVEQAYGKEVMVELAVAVATSRVYPAIKRGMGYAKSCSIMNFDFKN